MTGVGDRRAAPGAPPVADRVDRYAIEIRLLLDLVSHELHRLAPDPETPIRVAAGVPGLAEDLADRLWPDHPPGDATSPVVVHLLNETALDDAETFAPQHLVLAFRNRTSHKVLLDRGWGVGFRAVERRLERTHRRVSSRGVMGPALLARLLLAAGAMRRSRFELGYLLNDRALLAPGTSGPGRYLCAYGLVVATRRG